MNYPSVHRWLVEHTSLEPSLLEGAGFESVVAERLAETASTESAYVVTLEHSTDEVDRLVGNIAVPETWLFRYPRSFQLLVEFLQRRRASERGAAQSLRMCSIGCATGQEPYCMAMAALHAGWTADKVSIIGLDRNQDFLRAAVAAQYGPASIRGEIPDWAVRHLTRSGEQIGIAPDLCAMVQFTQMDVTEPAALAAIGPCDSIFCRNVLIYLNVEARTRLLDSICEALAPDGLLFVGHAEQAIRNSAPFRPVSASHAFALERFVAAPAVPEERPKLRTLPELVVKPMQRSEGPVREKAAIVTSRDSTGVPDLSLSDARDLADAGRIHDGENLIRSIIARRGPSAPALELLGTIRMAANDARGAKRLFEQAVYLEPNRSTSLMHLAIISERSGDSRRAAMLWDRARRASVGAAGDKERRS